MKFSPQIHKHSLIRQIQTENISQKRPPAGPPTASNAQASAIPLQMFPVTLRVHRAFYNQGAYVRLRSGKDGYLLHLVGFINTPNFP